MLNLYLIKTKNNVLMYDPVFKLNVYTDVGDHVTKYSRVQEEITLDDLKMTIDNYDSHKMG